MGLHGLKLDRNVNKYLHHVSDAAKQHLLNSMRSLETARANTPAIPLYGKNDWSVVTDFYKYAQANGISYPKWQLEYELSRETKFGDQGGHASWSELQPDVFMYVTNCKSCKVNQPVKYLHYAKLNCKKLSAREALRNQINTGKIEDKAAGDPNYNLKKTDKVAQDTAISYANSGRWEETCGYVFSYIRKKKNRIFIPGPFCVNTKQAQYHDPFLLAIKNDLLLNGAKSDFTFWGDKVSFKVLFTEIMTQKTKIHGLTKSNSLYVVRDFFHMDTTQGPEQKQKHYIPKLAKAFGIKPGSKEYSELEKVILYSNRMPIITPVGVITNNVKGEASGVTVTNNGETAVNEDYDESMKQETNKRASMIGIYPKIHYEWADTYGNGDDGFGRIKLLDISKSELESLKRIIQEAAEYTAKQYGLIVNDKWRISTEFGIYCQYEIYLDDEDNLHADYPASLAINAGMHPMREVPKKVWDRDYVDWRWEAALRPLAGRKDFTVLVDYVDSGLKYGLFGKTKEDMIRILSKYERYKALRDSSYQYNIYEDIDDNPTNSPVIIYLMKKRGIAIQQAAGVEE